MSPFEWYKSCTQDWLGLEGERIWTLSSYGVTNIVIYQTEVSYSGEKMTDMLSVVPSLYLKPNIEITNLNEANGSHNLPYELKLIS